MKLIKPSVEILTPIDRNTILKQIEIAGRCCYKSEDRITEDSASKFVRNLVKRDHLAMVEHTGFTAKFVCDRGILAEISRHRICSLAVESTRYVNYGKTGNCTFIIPPWYELEEGIYSITRESTVFYKSTEDSYSTKTLNLPYDCQLWLKSLQCSEDIYLDLLENKQTPQQARSVLPNSLKTEIVMTANMREFRHFFKLRTDKPAHPQMREVANMLFDKVVAELPELFDDIIPYRE